jgi:hypothetical protein
MDRDFDVNAGYVLDIRLRRSALPHFIHTPYYFEEKIGNKYFKITVIKKHLGNCKLHTLTNSISSKSLWHQFMSKAHSTPVFYWVIMLVP